MNCMEENSAFPFPSVIPLMSSKEKLKCRKIRAVLRYHIPNRHKYPEKYAHHLLFMYYYPFRSETELLNATYLEKLSQPGVLDIVNNNESPWRSKRSLVLFMLSFSCAHPVYFCKT